jgi:hypothetical protein
MALYRSKLPRRFAVIGIAIGFALFVMWWSIITYNLFHFPAPETPGNYSAPWLFWFLRDSMFILCPPLVLEVVAFGGTGYAVPLFIWAVAALINGALYYCLGLAIDALVRKLRCASTSPATRPTPRQR